MAKQSLLKYAKKFVEYKKDPIKFIRECVYIPLPGGDVLFDMYKPQENVLRELINNHYVIMKKSRQIGFSTLCQAFVTYICTFYKNCVIGVISRDGPESSDFCRKVEDMIDKLPAWIRPKYKVKSAQSFILANGCQLWASPVSPANPSSIFRGKSIVLLIIDEAAFIRRIDEAWTGIAPALSKAQKTAKEQGIPYGTIILSSPNRMQGIGKWFFEQWRAAVNGESAFKPIEIHWSEVEEFANDPNWYEHQCRMLNYDKRRIAQELDLKFIGADDTLFPEHVQEALQKNNTKPVEIIKIDNRSELWRFKDINKRKFHIIGVDTASAGGQDRSAIQVIEYASMDQVLEFCGKLPVKAFSKIVKFCAMLVPHNIIVIENNSYGNQVIEELLYDPNYHFNLFGELKGKGPNAKFIPGLNTNPKTRPLIIDALYTMVCENPDLIKSNRLALELLSLVDKRNKIEADVGQHDDLALAYAFVCYARMYGKQLLGNTEDLPENEGEENEEFLFSNIKEDTSDMESDTDYILSLNLDDPMKALLSTTDFQHINRKLEEMIKSKNFKGGVISIFDA